MMHDSLADEIFRKIGRNKDMPCKYDVWEKGFPKHVSKHKTDCDHQGKGDQNAGEIELCTFILA